MVSGGDVSADWWVEQEIHTSRLELVAEIDSFVAVLDVDLDLRVDAGDQSRDDTAGGEGRFDSVRISWRDATRRANVPLLDGRGEGRSGREQKREDGGNLHLCDIRLDSICEKEKRSVDLSEERAQLIPSPDVEGVIQHAQGRAHLE